MSFDSNTGNSISSLMELSLALQSINKIIETRYGLSLVQWSLLRTLLNMPAVSPQILAKALGVTPGSLSQTLLRLDRKKYLFMCDDPNDARKKMISITRLGKNTLTAVDKEFKHVFSNIDQVETQIKQLYDFLENKVKSHILESDKFVTSRNQAISSMSEPI